MSIIYEGHHSAIYEHIIIIIINLPCVFYTGYSIRSEILHTADVESDPTTATHYNTATSLSTSYRISQKNGFVYRIRIKNQILTS